MAVTILERPQGQVLSTTAQTASISSSYGTGDATAYKVAAHGLSDGAYIFVVSDIEDYNGFWYVDSTGTYTFKLKQYPTSDYVQYIQDATITYYVSELSHGWSAVHLPITYRLSSDLYPTNSVDTTRNINSVQNANGYTVILLSGSLGSGVNSYDFVKITIPNDTDLSGIYQIMEFISPTVMVINLEYDAANDFTGATAIKEYNNYNILVRVNAGINSGHEWATQKPYELAATLELIPDENGEVFFSINEILKSYIETRNNLLLGTLPNNIDFWTNFYIETAERYDDSDGYAFGSNTSNYTSDQSNFEGYAVNADLEFKNIQSGYMSDYLMNHTTAKFLTLFTIPVLFGCTDDAPDCYNEITFIKPSDSDFILNKQYYSNGNAGLLETETISGDEGIYRIPIEPNCAYDRLDVSLIDTALQFANTNFTDSISPWESFSGSDRASGTQNGTFAYNSGRAVSGISNFRTKYFAIPNDGGWPIGTYVVEITIIGFSENGPFTAAVYGMPNSSSQTLIASSTSGSISTNGITESTITLTFTTASSYAYLAFVFDSVLDVGDVSVSLGSMHITSSPAAEVPVSETKQYKIDCGCSAQEIRLTWLTNLPAFDQFKFTAEKDLIVEIRETGETKKNILPQWPKSYGANADTIRRQTFRVSNKGYTIRSQYMTQAEADGLAYIKSSVLVQIINSRNDRRTVIVDSDSFLVYPDGADLYSIAFNISFTDDIPSQTV